MSAVIGGDRGRQDGTVTRATQSAAIWLMGRAPATQSTAAPPCNACGPGRIRTESGLNPD
ncbi:hypothetical protein LK07_03155 [Streptomyces pluripotens]|uniref:Uncharacterized protein n=1 Tax=Streptomyces pluripotens TaxID=1355015 RepID=A0A221NT72_9ACTN|nr:hypothetical protein LK07_03155 [Streptomyces pluripotens]